MKKLLSLFFMVLLVFSLTSCSHCKKSCHKKCDHSKECSQCDDKEKCKDGKCPLKDKKDHKHGQGQGHIHGHDHSDDTVMNQDFHGDLSDNSTETEMEIGTEG